MQVIAWRTVSQRRIYDFDNGGCPIHLKGAPEFERRKLGCAASPENVCISYIKMVSFLCIPGDIY